MKIAKLRSRTVDRLILERAALMKVCACEYYDLADCLDGLSDDELEEIFYEERPCSVCGIKGDA